MTALAAIQDPQGWQARLDIHFSNPRQKTIISSLKHSGPLRVQRPFYPEGDVAHVYLLHPPGGVVGGDTMDIQVQAQEASHALLTMPGATKFYRSIGDTARVTQNLYAEKNSVLEWFPQENIFFPGANVKLQTTIHLTGNARFMGWEINCLGRPMNNEKFDAGEVDGALRVIRDGTLFLLERQRVNQQRHLSASAGLRNFPMNGIFLCTACDEKHLVLARQVVADLSPDFPVAITRIDDILILRVLGFQTEVIQKILIAVWQTLRPLIVGKEAVLPRIWST